MLAKLLAINNDYQAKDLVIYLLEFQGLKVSKTSKLVMFSTKIKRKTTL